MCYGVQKVRMKHPRWYYNVNLLHRVFEFVNLLCKIFVLERDMHFEFALIFGYDRYLFLNFLSIHFALGDESGFVVVMVSVVKTDVVSDKLIG